MEDDSWGVGDDVMFVRGCRPLLAVSIVTTYYISLSCLPTSPPSLPPSLPLSLPPSLSLPLPSSLSLSTGSQDDKCQDTVAI